MCRCLTVSNWMIGGCCLSIVIAYNLRMGMILNPDEGNENHVSYKKIEFEFTFSRDGEGLSTIL